MRHRVRRVFDLEGKSKHPSGSSSKFCPQRVREGGGGKVRGEDSIIADLNVLIMAGKWVWHSATADTNAGSVCEMPAARHPAQRDVHVILNTLS